jgi:hypothetical protein
MGKQLRHLTSKKSEYLNDTAAEAWKTKLLDVHF